MKVFVLAGGKGERVFPYSTILPKPLFPVAGKPCVRWIVERLIKNGLNDIILCINKQWYKNFEYEFRDISIRMSITEEPCGTSGEVSCALPFWDGKPFMIIYGDDLTEIEYKNLMMFHSSKRNGTLALTSNFNVEVGLVEMEGNLIKSFKEKPRIGNIWTGTAILEPEVTELCEEDKDFARDIFPQIKLQGYVTDSMWLDVGNIQHWKRANEHFRGK